MTGGAPEQPQRQLDDAVGRAAQVRQAGCDEPWPPGPRLVRDGVRDGRSRRGFPAEQRFQRAQRIAEAGGRGLDRGAGIGGSGSPSGFPSWSRSAAGTIAAVARPWRVMTVTLPRSAASSSSAKRARASRMLACPDSMR